MSSRFRRGIRNESRNGEDIARKENITNVIDGDMFEMAKRKIHVCLANVDAPEKGQPGAGKATEALRKLIQGEKVIIHAVGVISTAVRWRTSRPAGSP